MTNRAPVVFLYPKGHCRAQTFYFRGDDVHKEPEYLDQKKKDLLMKYKNTQKEVEKVKAEFLKVQEELQTRDGYTVALASALGSESSLTTENARLRHELADITTQIEAVERKISKVKQTVLPGVITGYIQEKAYYNAEIKELSIKIWEGVERIREGKLAMCRAVTSDEYSSAMVARGMCRAKRITAQSLKKKATDKFQDVSASFGGGVMKKKGAFQLPAELKKLVEDKETLEMKRELLELQCNEEAIIAQQSALALIDQIDRMNQVLVALGGEELDTERLRDYYGNIEIFRKATNGASGQKRSGSSVGVNECINFSENVSVKGIPDINIDLDKKRNEGMDDNENAEPVLVNE